ncbi:MAG: MFS transporter [candidate division FCPU426 bacterium]
MEKHDPYGALRHGSYRLFLACGQANNLSNQAVAVAVGFHLYNLTGSALCFLFVGLANYLPIFFFGLPAGLLADRVDRKTILRVCHAVMALCALTLAYFATHNVPVWNWYGVVFLAGTARAINTPASVAFYPTLMPEGAVANAVAWNSSNFQIGAVLGPVLGGLLIEWKGPQAALLFGALGPALVLALLFVIVPQRPFVPKPDTDTLWQRITIGLRFVFNKKVILAALTLDLFAVLFGGAEALFPMFAKDILHVGAAGLGCLRAAPFLGAFLGGFFLIHRPMRSAGKSMLFAVAGFGLCMMVFGWSHNFILSLVVLGLAGACDIVSVVVRQTLIQISTPDELRGRVQAVNFLFIGSSNELGEVESGATARLFGPVASVVGGGMLTLVAVAAVWRIWPELKALEKIERSEA